MRIFEISNDHLDYSDEWLSKWTYEGVDAWPSKNIIQSLIKKYPVTDSIIVYRGMNFRTEDEWKEFIQQIKSGNSEITFSKISSWSPSKNTAHQFAVTRPTYFLNAELMKAETQRNNEREYLSGYRGIIIETQLSKETTGIDVRKSKFAKEDEIILLPGTYQVKVTEVIKKYSHALQDGEETVQSILEKMVRGTTEKELNEYMRGFYEFITHFYKKDIVASDEFKEMVYRISMKETTDRKLVKLVRTDIQKPFSWDIERNKKKNLPEDPSQITILYHPAIFYLDQQGFLPEAKKPLLRRYADKIFREYVLAVKKYPNAHFNFGGLSFLEKYVSDPIKLAALVRKTVGSEYNRLNSREEIDRINRSGNQQDAIRQYTDRLMKTLGQLDRT